jgi:hypothetical protein
MLSIAIDEYGAKKGAVYFSYQHQRTGHINDESYHRSMNCVSVQVIKGTMQYD